jgi:hypothetical protein
MSTTTSNGPRPAGRAAIVCAGLAEGAAAKSPRPRHTPGGAALGKDAGHEAQRLAAAILDVLAGVRTPSQAAEALGVSVPRYYQVETRALQALVAACQARPRGPGRSADRELAALRRQQQRLQSELNRQQTLVRLAQRTIGLAPPKPPAKPDAKDKSKKRRRRPVVRALRAAETLQRRSQEAQNQDGQGPQAAVAASPPEMHEES